MSTLRVFGAFLLRDWRIARSYRLAIILAPIEGILLLATFFYVGRIVDPAQVPGGDQLQDGYFAFAVIGLALVGVLWTGLDAFASTLRSEQTVGTLEALLTTRTRPALLVAGSVGFAYLRAVGLAVGMVALAIVFFGLRLDVTPASALVAFGGLVASIVLFAAVGLMIAAVVVVVKHAGALLGLVTTIVSLLGGVYFPLEVLPSWLQAVAELIPFTWAVEVVRSALLDAELELGRLALLVVVSLVLLPVGGRVFVAALRRARREGSLAQY